LGELEWEKYAEAEGALENTDFWCHTRAREEERRKFFRVAIGGLNNAHK